MVKNQKTKVILQKKSQVNYKNDIGRKLKKFEVIEKSLVNDQTEIANFNLDVHSDDWFKQTAEPPAKISVCTIL